MSFARAVLIGLALLLAAPAPRALASCTDDLKILKVEYAKVREVRKRDMVRKQISAADTALKRKNETACRRAVASGNRILRQRP